MSFAKIVAIVRTTALADIERALQQAGVPGMSVSQVKGFGDYADFFRRDWMVSQVRIEIFIQEARAEEIAETLMEAAHTGLEGDGLVAIQPVKAIYHIRTRQRCESDIC